MDQRLGQRLGLCFLVVSVIRVAACQPSPPPPFLTPGPAPYQATVMPYEVEEEVIIIVIDEVTPLRSGEDGADNPTEFRLLLLGSNAENVQAGMICPLGDAVVLTAGQTVRRPCATILAFDPAAVGEAFGLVIVGLDEDDMGLAGEIGSAVGLGALAKGITAGLKSLAHAGSAAGGPVVFAGELAIETAVGYVGGEVADYFEQAEVIGQQGFVLRPDNNWGAGPPVSFLTQDSGMRVVLHIARMTSESLPGAVATLPAAEGAMEIVPAPAATPLPPTAAPQFIDRLVLVAPGGGAMTLSDGATVDLSRWGRYLDVVAEVNSPAVGSVIFMLDGRPFCSHERCLENIAPYTMNGDIEDVPYGDWDWAALAGGQHTIAAQACTHANGEGECAAVVAVRVGVRE